MKPLVPRVLEQRLHASARIVAGVIAAAVGVAVRSPWVAVGTAAAVVVLGGLGCCRRTRSRPTRVFVAPRAVGAERSS